MTHMNSVYCYCDVVLFLEAPLPDLDERVYECELVPSEHEWLRFIDTIQYVGDEKGGNTIRKNDIVVGVNKMKETVTLDMLRKINEKCKICCTT